MIKGCIFDLDGTLVNTLSDYMAAINHVMERRGFPLQSDLEVFKSYFGKTSRGLIEYCLPEGEKDESIVLEALPEMMEHYEHNCLVNSRPYDGIHELLKELETRGVSIAVISDKEDHIVRKVIAALFPDIRFDYIEGLSKRCSPKPHPGRILSFLELAGIEPEECIMIGDEVKDMQMAKDSGVRVVGVTWGYHLVEDLLQNGAEMIIELPRMALELF